MTFFSYRFQVTSCDTCPHQMLLLDSLGHIGNAVPETIELGCHLCYGRPRDEHVVQHWDLAVSVEIANRILARVRRPLQFIHMPVPKDRNDDVLFQPLTNLALSEGTDLYLGCLHRGDDAGNAAKLARARSYARVTDISSECSWGRSDPAHLDAILAAHKTLSHRPKT
ncbi:MAG: hypothetical protein OEU26_16940 [Candidatus Tectomicrobia bacterium]|nr:hypothetical protein [Candidatus Tectomicrobia bacterium]